MGSHLTAFYVRVIQVSGRYYQPRTISLCVHLTRSFANDHGLFSLSSWWLLRFGQHLPQPDILPQRGRSTGPAPQRAWKTPCLPSRGLRCHRGKKQGTKNRPLAWKGGRRLPCSPSEEIRIRDGRQCGGAGDDPGCGKGAVKVCSSRLRKNHSHGETSVL